MPAPQVTADVVVFGGGVAGLWLLGRLRAAGYGAALVESRALGAGQTRYAQGIIHGGTKYALTGVVDPSAEAVAAMPSMWRACLEGHGELDLTGVRLMAPNQFLWSTANLTSRLAGFFASKLMRSRTTPLEPDERPAIFRHPRFHGQVYRLDEPVLDTRSLVERLAAPHAGLLTAAGTIGVERHKGAWRVTLDGDRIIDATTLVFAAGAGNAELLAAAGRDRPAMQRRPLRMVMARGNLPDGVYAHCLGASANPRITISTHYDSAGRVVWYLGGQIAEEGVKRTDAEQIAAARAELGQLLPWVDLDATEWATLDIDRAEPRQGDGRRPEGAFADLDDGIVTAWPTKLALAPRLAADVMTLIEKDLQSPTQPDLTLPADWPRPGVAPLPWQEEERWS